MLISKESYVSLVRSSHPTVVNLFMGRGGWQLIYQWATDAIDNANYPLLKEILNLVMTTPVSIPRLKSNRFPILLKSYSKVCKDEAVRKLSKLVVSGWRRIAAFEENKKAIESSTAEVPSLGGVSSVTGGVSTSAAGKEMISHHRPPNKQKKEKSRRGGGPRVKGFGRSGSGGGGRKPKSNPKKIKHLARNQLFKKGGRESSSVGEATASISKCTGHPRSDSHSPPRSGNDNLHSAPDQQNLENEVASGIADSPQIPPRQEEQLGCGAGGDEIACTTVKQVPNGIRDGSLPPQENKKKEKMSKRNRCRKGEIKGKGFGRSGSGGGGRKLQKEVKRIGGRHFKKWA